MLLKLLGGAETVHRRALFPPNGRRSEMAGRALPWLLPKVECPDLEYDKYLNLALLLRERRQRKAEVRSKPIHIVIDPSTVCQLSCPYCHVGSDTIRRAKRVMGPEIQEQVLPSLKRHLFIIWYFSTGEPLLNKQFPDLVAETRGSSIFSIVSTNLSLELSDAQIDRLLLCGLGSIIVSLDGASAEIYARYRVGGDFDLVVRNMRRLVERKRALGLEHPLIEWRFLLFEHNLHEVPEARRLANEYGVDSLEFFPGDAPRGGADSGARTVRAAPPHLARSDVSGPALERAKRHPKGRVGKVIDGTPSLRSLLRSAGRKATRRLSGGPPEHLLSKKCDWLYFGTTIYSMGSVGPCCASNQEEHDFGRLDAEASFGNVWSNPSYQEARRLFVTGEPSKLICARCPQPMVQDYLFRNTLRALLRNAPDWFLRVISTEIDRFFFEIDHWLSPDEFAAVASVASRLDSRFPDIEARLAAEGVREADPERLSELEWIHGALATTPKRRRIAISKLNFRAGWVV